MVNNGYAKGLNRDMALSFYDKQSYFDLINMKVVTQDGGTTLNLESEEGNQLLFNVPDLPDLYKIDFSGQSTYTLLFNIDGNVVGASNANSIEDIQLSINQAISSGLIPDTFRIWISGNVFYMYNYGADVPISITSTNGINQTSTFTDPKIVGITRLNEWFVLFTTDSTNEDSTNDIGQIWKFKYLNEDKTEIDGVDAQKNLSLENHLIRHAESGWSTVNYIRDTVVRFESDNIGRVYYTDYFNEVSSFNIFDPNLYERVIGDFRQNPEITFDKPTVEKIENGGNLPYDSHVRYFYRLISENGTVTPFSPGSDMIRLNEDLTNDPNVNWEDMLASNPNSGNNKRLTVRIPNIPSEFETLELYSVIWIGKDNPVVYYIDEAFSSFNNGVFEYVHDGLGTESQIPLSEFNYVSTGIVAKTIEDKFNRLFVANLKESTFDVDFDARAYRFKRVGATSDTEAVLLKQDGTSTTINGSSPDFNLIPDDHDCINPTNLEFDEDYVSYRFAYQDFSGGNYTASDQQIYKADGTTVGGQGSNVSYEFVTEELYSSTAVENINNKPRTENIRVDGDTQRYGVSDTFTTGETDSTGLALSTSLDGSIKSFKDNRVTSVMTGYARGEVYRFGIVFYDKQGRNSFAKWIGDIKFPDSSINEIYKVGDAVNPNQNGYDPREENITTPNGSSIEGQGDPDATVNTLGISFTVDVSSISDDISGFKIVRAERGANDRSRVAMGILWQYTTFADEADNSNKVELYQKRAFTTSTDIGDGTLTQGLDYSDNKAVPYYRYYDFIVNGGFEGVGQYGNPITNMPNMSAAMRVFSVDYGGIQGEYNTIQMMPEPSFSYSGSISFSTAFIDANRNTDEKVARQIRTKAVNQFISPDSEMYTQTGFGLRQGADYIKEIGYMTYFDECYDDYRRSNTSVGATGNRYNSLSFLFRAKSFRTVQHPVYSGVNGTNTTFTVENTPNYFKVDKMHRSQLGEPFWDSRSGVTQAQPTGQDNFLDDLDLLSVDSDILNGTPDRYVFLLNTTHSLDGTTDNDLVPGGLGTPSTMITLNRDNSTLHTGSDYMKWRVKQASDGSSVYAYGWEDSTYTLTYGANNNIYIGTEAYSAGNKWKGKTGYMKLTSYVRDLANQYGGNTYLEKQKTTYIDTGHYQPLVKGTTFYTSKVFGGDTEVAMFSKKVAVANWDQWKDNLGDIGVYKDAGSMKVNTVVAFPCESYISDVYKLGDNWSRSERGALYQDVIDDGNNRTDMSRSLTSITGLPGEIQDLNSQTIYRGQDPLNANLSTVRYPNRIRNSEFKQDNERLDNYRVFLPANFKDVSGSNGEIHKLKHFKSNMYFFQDRAVGYQAIQEKTTLQDQTGAALALGQGDVLGQHQYISDKAGTKHQESVISTKSGLYYFDSLGKSFNSVDGMEINRMKGLSEYFKALYSDDSENHDNIFDPNTPQGIITGYDPSNDRVLISNIKSLDSKELTTTAQFIEMGELVNYGSTYARCLIQGRYAIADVTTDTFKTIVDGDSDTVSFTEVLGAFESRPSYKPRKYFAFDNNMLSLPSSSSRTVWQHGITSENSPRGNYANFYGTQYDCELTLVITPSPYNNAIFNNIEFYSNITLNKEDLYNEHMDTIQVWNEYQNSGEITLTIGSNLRRRFRKWRTTIPRDILNQELPSKARMRNQYIFLKLTKNPTNRKLVLQDITTKIIPTQI